MLIAWRTHIVLAGIFALTLNLSAQDQGSAQSGSTRSTQTAKAKSSASGDGPRLCRNLGFSYQQPDGWVDRTEEMQHGDPAAKGQVLLAIFEHPPEATTDTINSAVVIACESASSYPGLKTAEDYLGPLTELVTAKGFKPDRDPYFVEEESRHLLRADFTKTINDKLTMRQSTLVLLTKGQIVSFTFIASSDDELDEIMDGLHFGTAKPGAH